MYPQVPQSHSKSGKRYPNQGYLQLPVLDANCCLPPQGHQWAEPEDLHLLDKIPNPVPKKTPLMQKKTYMMESLPVEYIEIPSLKKERLVPLNPVVAVNQNMTTGIKGRGMLGDWGPNFAADPIVTFYSERLKQWQLLLILRMDTLEWAFPGGMVDASDKDCSVTAKRELQEETGLQLGEMVEKESVIYRGYVDDDRNTDNAWMETSAVHFQLKVAEEVQEKLVAMVKGTDDAVYAMWFGIHLDQQSQNIVVDNNFEKTAGQAKWGDKYQEFCEKFQKSVAEKTKLPAPKGIGKEVVIQSQDPIFTKPSISLYASHDSILQMLKPILFK